MISLSLDELKLVAKNRGIKDYKNKSEDDLIKILSEPKTKISLSKKKIEDIRKDVNKSRHIFSKSKIKQIRKSLYDIKNPKNLSKSKIKEIEKNLLEFEKSLSKPKKYHDYDDNEYRGIRDVRSLFNQSFDKDYYKPIKTIGSFDNKNNYIEYESKGDKDKKLSPKEYLNMIRPYYKTTLGKWKFQLTMSINFISHKDSNNTRTMHTKSDNIEIMMSSETDEIIEELFKSLLQGY